MTSLSETSLLAGSSGQSTGYTINQSIRFNQDDSAYLTKTFGGSASNRRTHTYSFWLKLGARAAGSSSSGGCFFLSTNDSGASAGDYLHLNGDLELRYWSNESSASTFETTQLFRDFSAWYHIVLVNDRDNGVASEVVRLYVNGERVTSFSVNNISGRSGQDTMVNASSFLWMIQRFTSGTVHGDAYMTDIHFIDGYAYGPEYFGEFKEDTDIWIPKRYSNSYGTNGFKIDGRDSGDLGDDESGNGNDFGSSGLASNDQKADTPTNNMITFNPLNNQQSGGTPRNGNLEYTGPSTRTLISLTANIPTTGKWAVAFKATNNSNDEWNMGITKATNSNFGDAAGSNEAVGASDGIQFLPSSNDAQLYDYLASATIDPSLPITTSDEFWMAVDTATGKCFLGIYDASATAMKFVAADAGIDGNPATGDNPTITISDMIGSGDYTFAVNSKNTNVWTLLRSTEVSGTTPTGYTYFENVKDLL